MSKKHKERREDKSPHIEQRDKIKEDLSIRNFPFTEKQKKLIDLILDKNTKIVFIKGPAGCAKSLISVYCGLRMLKEKKVGELLYIRSIIESASKSLGALPGEADLKMQPFMVPLEDKLFELLPASQVKMLVSDERVKANVINYLRGASLRAAYLIGDEIQNFTFSELTTLITRVGEHSKLVICADPAQSDINGKSGFMPMFNIFNDEDSKAQGIHTFEFTREDIMRSGVVKFIVEKLEKYKEDKDKSSMFPEKS